MKIEDRIDILYQQEFSSLIEDLKSKTKEERYDLYIHAKSILFPDTKEETLVKIEYLLNDNVKSNRDKFKKCFYIICYDFFSPEHWGEYNFRRFKKKTGINSQNYFQQVILSLYLMGYITEEGIKCNKSTGNHGKIFFVDYYKWVHGINSLLKSESGSKDPFEHLEWNMPAPPDELPEREYSDLENAWLVKKQFATFNAMSVDEGIYSNLMKIKSDIFEDPYAKTWCSKEIKQLTNLEKLYKRSRNRFSIKIAGEEDRLYSIMTNLKSDWRKNGILTIEGMGFSEVDMSSLHPTLFGLMVKRENPDIKSQWVEHCLNGDFYEWVIDISGIAAHSIERLIKELDKSAGGYLSRRNTANETLKQKVQKTFDLIEELRKIDDDDPHVQFRPIVKHWIMKLLFDSTKLSSAKKDGDTIYKHFCHQFLTYLNENEPLLYEKLDWYRTKENQIPSSKNPDKKVSALPEMFRKEEVKYIKECLKKLDDKVRYLYTVHDCIGCLVSDADIVKQVMEQVSVNMYGVKLGIKIEGEAYKDYILNNRE